jgi:hypothetical protein
VKFHVSEILSRTGVRRRREAAEWSRERERERPTALLRGWRTRGVRLAEHRRRGVRFRLGQLDQGRIAC